MFEDILHQSQLRKLQKTQKRTQKAYKKDIEEAKKVGKSREEIDLIQHTDLVERQIYDEEIETLQSRYLMNKAQRYLLSTPEIHVNSEDWEQSDITYRWRLSLSAQEKVRSKIDEYEKRRRERVHSWMTAIAGFIGACTGLIGVLVGLIAVSC